MSDKYQRHSPTSREAALFASAFSGQAREQVFLQIIKQDGATDEEIHQALKMNPSTERPRRVELVEAGLVEDSGYERTVSSGMYATIWKATGASYDAAVFRRMSARSQLLKEREAAVLRYARQFAENPRSGIALMKLKQAASLLKME